MNVDLHGHRVLVTAGAAGIGLATARAFVAEGARVMVCDVDRHALDALGRSDAAIAAVECDVSDPDQVDRMFDVVRTRLGGLDTLVNNAGIAGPTGACEDIALADWRRTLDVNLTGMFLCAQRAIPLLKTSANPSMVNLSSAAGRFGFPLRSPYAATKWGVIGFTRTLSIELGGLGVRVNAICPGVVAGDRIDRVMGEKAQVRNVPVDVVRDELLGKTSLKRFVAPEEIANAIVFLASKLGANIDGHALPIDGDAQSLA